MTGIAAALREAQPGIWVRLLMADGEEVSGELQGVEGEAADLEDDGPRQVDLRQVKRLSMEFSAAATREPGRRKTSAQT